MTSRVLAARPGVSPAPARRFSPEAHPRRAAWIRRLPLLPALIFMIVVTQLPFVATLVISFMRWNALEPNNTGFTGFTNYKQVFTDSSLRGSVIATVIITVSVVLVSLAIGLGIALLLDRKFHGRAIVRTIMIAPFLIVPVAAALLFKQGIYNPNYGLLNGTITGLTHLFGGHNPAQPDWIQTQPKIAVEAALIWQWTPFMMLILLAGLQSRDPEVMEAARVDGVSPWQMFRFVTYPHVRRYLELGALFGAMFILQNFDFVFTITSGGLGTANLPYTIYQTFFSAHDYGLASAQGVVVVVASLILATFALRVVSSLLREEEIR
jgi:sorbitol/mannitol transport system permease protein